MFSSLFGAPKAESRALTSRTARQLDRTIRQGAEGGAERGAEEGPARSKTDYKIEAGPYASQARDSVRNEHGDKRAGFRPNVYLNNKVSVFRPSPHEAEARDKVACRHLALKFATFPGRKGRLLAGMSTPAGVQAKFAGTQQGNDRALDELARASRDESKHVLSENRFGCYLSALARALDCRPGSKGLSETNCLLSTQHHAMAWHFI